MVHDTTVLCGGLVYTERRYFEEQNIVIRNGKIDALLHCDAPLPDGILIDCHGKIILPGFLDIHIHGRDGFDVSKEPEKVARSLPQYGITAFLPTTLTRSFTETQKTMGFLAEYIDSQPKDCAEAVGIYSEGMYFSREKAGAQNPEFIRDAIYEDELEVLIQSAKGHLKVVAFAPEIAGAPEATAYLKKRKVRSSMAHTNALYSDVLACAQGGLDGVTHIYDGMRGMTHLELGAAGAATFLESLSAELIADGYHVNPEFINILFKFKPLEKIILISDNVPASGTPKGNYELGGMPIINEGDRLVLATADGRFSLAGSCLNLCDSIKNVHRYTGIPIEQLIPCVTENPAKYAGVYDKKGSLAVGKDADINIFTPDFTLCDTYVKGYQFKARE